MQDFETATQYEYGALLQRKEDLDQAITGLEIALSESETYRTLVRLKEEREHLFDDFKTKSLANFNKRGIKTVDGEYGKITMRESVRYKVTDESKVPEQFFKKAVDLDAVKEQFLLNKPVAGIEKQVSQSIILTPKRTEESS